MIGQIVLNPLVAGVATCDRLLRNRLGGPGLPEECAVMRGAWDRVTDLPHDTVLIDDDLDFAGVAFFPSSNGFCG